MAISLTNSSPGVSSVLFQRLSAARMRVKVVSCPHRRESNVIETSAMFRRPSSFGVQRPQLISRPSVPTRP
jgi:hypothetical protein